MALRRLPLALVVAAASLGSPRSARAGGGAATDAYSGVREGATLDVGALLDVYAQHAWQGTPDGRLRLRAFDTRSETPALGLARVTLAHRPDWFGFRLDVGAGDLADGYQAMDPAAKQAPELTRGLSYVEQAFVTARLPVGPGVDVDVDVGKLATPIGLEDNESLTNWNYSRSLLFLVEEPSVHTGVRATTPVSPALALSAFWLNGWDANVVGGDGMRSFAVAASWRAADGLDVTGVYAAGLEHPATQPTDPALTFRHAFDASVVASPRSWLSFAATGDYGLDAARGGVSWWGVGGYARAQALPWLAGSLRAEHLRDTDGYLTGRSQAIVEGTATIEAHERFGGARSVLGVVRVEWRSDRSDWPIFTRGGGGIGTRQDTLTLALLAAY